MKLTFKDQELKIRVDRSELSALQRGEILRGSYSPPAAAGIRWCVRLQDGEEARWELRNQQLEIGLPKGCAARLSLKAEQGAGRKGLCEPCGFPGAVLELDYFDVRRGE